jgi:predicted DNA-binding transcriptional regulator YafY
MERHWHDSQKLELQGDGSVTIELQIGNLWEVKRWLIGWGGSAEVLMPSTLKEEILSECQKIIAMGN